jgi:integrase/recombinase XerD
MPSPDPERAATSIGAPDGGAGGADFIRELERTLRRSGRSENGIQAVLTDVRQLLEFAGNRSLLEFQGPDVMAFLRWLETERGHKPASIRRKLTSVRLLFDFYRRQGKIDANPAHGIGIVSPTPQRPLPLTPAQSRRLVSAASSDRRWHVLVLLMLTAGLKREEVVRLSWTDVSRDVRTGVTQITIRGRSPGAVNARTLSIPRVTAEALQRLADSLPGSAQGSGAVLGLSARGVDYAVAQCADRASLGHLKITPQRLRDTFAVGILSTLRKREVAQSRVLSPRGQADVRRGFEQGFLRILGVGRNRALINYYRAALVEREDTDGAEGVFLRDRDFASADEL